MKKILFLIFMILLAITASVNIVSAQNSTDEILMNNNAEEEKEKSSTEEVKALESGHLNTTFDNGYKGYCIDYRDEEAQINDKFEIKTTDYALNNNTNESIGNYLKVFFVDYYDVAMKDNIVTQHIIWHFSDDFNGWRIDPELIESIKLTASQKTVPDHGAKIKIDNETEAIFDFIVLSSRQYKHQNYFAYKITYQKINESENSTIENKSSINTNQTTTENITSPKNITNREKNEEIKTKKLQKHQTGNSTTILLTSILMIIGSILIKRD